MSAIRCRRCGRMTNTAMSDHVDSKDGMADKCFIAFVNGETVKGCAYQEVEGPKNEGE